MKANILFATMSADGHFKPLTALAKHLQGQGYDVRWYTGNMYQQHLQKLNIPHFPFRKALEISQSNLDAAFPERKKHKSTVAKLKFDIKEVFVRRIPEYVEDLKAIYEAFPFELIIADYGFTAVPLIRNLFHIPVIGVGVVPLMETSRDLPPYGMGIMPSHSFWGRPRQALLRFVAKNMLFKESIQELNKIFQSYHLKPSDKIIFDIPIHYADLYLQSGVPGFEYQRSDMSKNIHFIGALLPYKLETPSAAFVQQDKLKQYKKVILVTQGTVEKDVEKILVPTLEAYKDSDYLVIATTGGSQTKALQTRYPQDNIIIEDFIDFNYIMPHADVYITNGGYGGVMLGISHRLPLVVAGLHEGKSEINARVGYFKLGVNLKTEKPTTQQIRKGVEEVLTNPSYKKNVRRLAEEFHQYDPAKLCEKYVEELLYNHMSQEKQSLLHAPEPTTYA